MRSVVRRVFFILRSPFAVFILFAVTWAIIFWKAHHVQPTDIRNEYLFKGVSYSRKVLSNPRPKVIHIVKIDLTEHSLRFLATPADLPKDKLSLRARTTTEFLRTSGVQFAINGDFFDPYHPAPGTLVGVEGFASSRGVSYGADERRWQRPALCITADNKASIKVLRPTDDVPFNAIGGDRFLVRKGSVTDAARLDQRPNPRTAIGIDAASKHLILVVVDGRQPGISEGSTLGELASTLSTQGAFTAMNLDGGGSSEMAIRQPDGEPTILNSPVGQLMQAGSERAIANHLGVFVEP